MSKTTAYGVKTRTDNIWQTVARSRQFRRVTFFTTVVTLTLSTVSWHATQASTHEILLLSEIENGEVSASSLSASDSIALLEARLNRDAQWHTYKVKLGENLENVRRTAGVSEDAMHAILDSGKQALYLNSVYPGDEIRLLVTANSELLALEYDILKSRRLLVSRDYSLDNPLAYKAEIIDRPLEIQVKSASGVITRSLFESAKQQGLSTNIIMELVRIFDWDIDFNQDIKKGDHFSLIYEEHYRAGEKIADGPIVAAKFVNNGKIYHAIRYTTPDGKTAYYTPDGYSLRKPFLRNPVDSAIVSSKFDPSRKHPILSTIRAHNGVDYAAKIGTPIKVSGDGQIIFIGRKGGYGNTVIVQHSEHRSTLYAHMQKFPAHLKLGKKVRQGEIIGYVGKSGLATGPHLHYEFRVDGKHVDPLSVKLANRVIPTDLESEFNKHAIQLLAKLNAADKIAVALNEITRKNDNKKSL